MSSTGHGLAELDLGGFGADTSRMASLGPRLLADALAAAAVAISTGGAQASAQTMRHCRPESLHDGGRVYDLVSSGASCSTARTVAKPSGPHSISGRNPNYRLHAHPRYRSHGFLCTASGTVVEVGIANWYFDCTKGKRSAPTAEITFEVTFPHGYKG